ncbi:HesA/MoeB/ThiF family protein [Maliponia aquimaris]|uniref:Sulfur carrier protein ThiS adenylyltransferase n=1 Tax=Maliponia aquimaris TaxID=1673631 RepID=A0A238KZT3_9RHOB|nr:HesA/MoeB/ThiF family protein [Maliponia aquimaris]SMX48081.1 Sulfur carrier protein ThiS adenylyltransferase [Maliponia aquimaris]
MDDQQLLRYSRHILLNELDIPGQERILAGHVLVIGAGGLGSPVATYLAGAGVGHLTICDGDEVDLTNLQRQILHREPRIGMNKAQSAVVALAEINPDCKVTAVPHYVGPDTLSDLVAAADVVVDACDNLPTRHTVNRACVRHLKPLVSGAAIRFAGQLGVFDPRLDSCPCYACFMPENTPMPEERCAAMGVFAPLTGTIGTMQAAEVLHLLISGTSGATGRLLLYDALATEWQAIDIPRNPACPVCATRGPGSA